MGGSATAVSWEEHSPLPVASRALEGGIATLDQHLGTNTKLWKSVAQPLEALRVASGGASVCAWGGGRTTTTQWYACRR